MTLANVNVSKNFLGFLENLGLLEDQQTIRDLYDSENCYQFVAKKNILLR